MTQLIVSLEDTSMLSDIKNAIRLLRGVVSVRESKGEPFGLSDETLRRIELSREQYRKGGACLAATHGKQLNFSNPYELQDCIYPRGEEDAGEV